MVIIITGLLLSGKTTLAKQLRSWGYKPVLEYTTRPMREGEQNGVDYLFTDDAQFEKIRAAGEFAETLDVNTIYGLWKYGARKEDLKDNHVLVCGPTQVQQIIESGVPVLSVLLDIDREEAIRRAAARGDDIAEFNRRFDTDKPEINRIRNQIDLILDACNSAKDNAKAIDRGRVARTGEDYMRSVDGWPVITAQEMSEGELNLYLSGDRGLMPGLKMKGRGMPQNSIAQIAWLLLQGGGCGFCKVCRPKPCGIKDGESCTANIANYIRDCVHAEDRKKKAK